ncbi:ATP-grasp domain-containing protein [Candidatus Shapirobacteria bacterium]|nr:ATP-grasp domain-containing protein [Candidatus Shapirobacteria bacterium]
MISEPIFYLTNDVSHGIGVEKLLPNYHIICIDDHPLVTSLIEAGVRVLCLERLLKRKNIIFRSSGKLLEQPEVANYIKENSGSKTPNILYFKPSPKIDSLCRKRGYRRLGNTASLNRIFEDKISFYKICHTLGLAIPPGQVANLAKADFRDLKEKYGPKVVIQFGRGWAGSTTFFITDADQFNRLKCRFGNLEAKITKFINGKTVLNNCCVTRNEVLIGQPAEQIPRISDFTAKEGATCGRIWPASLNRDQVLQLEEITRTTGEYMRQKGYLGYFGLDFLLSEEGEIYLSENNARFTASAPFYSKLEIKNGSLPMALYHISVFLGGPENMIKWQRKEVTGSEIVVRNNRSLPITIKKDFQPGIYKLCNSLPKPVRSDYDVGGAKSESEFFLTAAAYGRIVNPEMELARLDTFASVREKDGKLADWAINLLKRLKKDLAG